MNGFERADAGQTMFLSETSGAQILIGDQKRGPIVAGGIDGGNGVLDQEVASARTTLVGHHSDLFQFRR